MLLQERKVKNMKNVLKRNQIIILVIALMLVSAGYLNYSGNKKEDLLETDAKSVEEEGTEYAGIGDAKLVSSNAIPENNEQVAIVPNEEIKSEGSISSNTINISSQINETANDDKQIEKKETVISEEAATTTNLNSNSISNTTTTSTKNIISKETQEYFSATRLNRETMYSQMIESYQKILENQTISETQKSIAQTEIQNINSTKNKIMICENLIKTKGFEDLIIFVNDKSISVVVRADSLTQEQIAQIQNIIAREMNAEVNDIHISNK